MRKVLSVWKAILLVFASFIGVGGLTALGVYLTGGFNEVVVNPADIYFSQEVSGEGAYNTTTSQYELSNDVNLKIMSSTEGVTKKEVTLMFTDADGRRVDQQLVDGYLSNGIIKIPQSVEIGKSFQVQLERENGAVVGGTSYIMAKSENIEIDTIRTKLAVDVPTSELQIDVQNSSEIDGVYHVVVDTTFKVFANFTPAVSKNMYGDATREKRVFFSVTGSGLNYDEEENVFYAQNITNGTDYTRIVAYAFSKAYYEERFFATHTNPTTNDVVVYLIAHDEERISKEIDVQVISVDVDDVSFSIDKSNVKLLVDKETIITTNGDGDRSLGAVVKNSQDLPLTSLLGQVGIKLPTGVEGLSIRGGNVVRVTATEITLVGPNEIVEEEGVDYYILPNTGATSARNYHWTFETTEPFASMQMQLNFFYEKNGGWVKFFDDGEEKYFNLLAEQHLDSAVGWKNTEIISMLISFDQEGRTITDSVNLSALINNVPEDNVYKTIKYFLLSDDSSVVANLQTIFDCGPAVEYSNEEISLVGVSQKDSYALYEVNGDVLTVLKSISGVVKVVPVIVKTNAQGVPYKDGNKYVIANVGSAKEIIVDSTLSVNKMSVAYHFNEDEVERTEGGVTTGSIFELNGNYYLPAVRKDDNGQDITLIYFDLELESDDVEGDADKVLNAQRDEEQLLKVVCVNINGTDSDIDYVYLNDLQISETTENSVIFVGSLAINSEVDWTEAYNGIYVKLELRYTDKQRDEVYSKPIKQQETETDGFYIYYQKPESLVGAYEETREIEDPIDVTISIADGVQITWTTDDVIESTTDLMNELLSFTILDQKGKLIRTSDRIYRLKFIEEEPYGDGWREKQSNKAISFDSNGTAIMNFIPNGANVVTTYAAVYILDKEDNRVYGEEEGETTRFTFQITGEGLSAVRYDTSKDCGVADLEDAPSMSEIFVEKNVEADSVIILNTLFEIETSAGIVDKAFNPYTITLDSTFVSTFGGEASRDMMKMMAFKLFGADESGDDEGYDLESGRTLAKYLGEDIAELKVFAPFNSRTLLTFNITDANNLYVVKLHITFLANIDTQSNFETLVAPYRSYLSINPTNPTAINVVANSTYSLDDAMPFTDNHYVWSRNAVGFESSNEDVISMPTPGTIKIENVYHNTLVKIYVYFGVESQYAYSIELNFYVHPNIIMLERSTFVDIADYGDLSTYYTLIEMKTFVDSGTIREVSLTEDFEYVNNTLGPRYISLNSAGVFSLEEATLNYEFGTKYSQTFQIKHNDEEQIRFLDFALVHANRNVEMFEADKATFSFELGYGSDAEEEMVQAIVSGAKVVTYKGEPTLVLVAGKEYNLLNYTIYSFVKANTVFNTGVTDAIVVPDNFGSYFVDDEALGLTTKAGRLTINIVLKAIVSKVGDIFVYYDPEVTEGKDFSYLLSTGTTLANYEIYQKVFAGTTYDVLTNSGEVEAYVKVANTELIFNEETKHYVFDAIAQDYQEIVLYVKTATDPDVYELATEAEETYYYLSGSTYVVVSGDIYEKKPVPGFYYDEETLGRTSSLELSVESQGLEGLARIVDNKLVLSDLTADENGQYVVLKLQVSNIAQPDNKFVWYYRLRVYSNFEKGEVYYPYQSQAEYLDQFSEFYSKGSKTYTIHLDEEHGDAAYNVGKKRFEDDAVDYTTTEYRITNVKINGVSTANYSAYIDISISADNILTMCVNSTETKIDVELTKTYSREGIEMLGADLVYLFKINQSTTYSPVVELYRKEKQYNDGVTYYVYDDATESYIEATPQPTSATFAEGVYYSYVTLDSATQTDRTYTASMNAGDSPVQFDTLLYEVSNGTRTKVNANDYHVALVGNLDDEGHGKYVDPEFDFENETLILYPNSDIEINGVFTIVFYTEEKAAFKIVMNAKSYFEFEQKETSISAGETRSFDYFVDVVNTKDDSAEIIHNLRATTNQEYVSIDNENQTITFAYLLDNVDITFVDTIKETPDGEDKFTFEFTIRVNARSPFAQNSITNTTKRFGQVSFDVDIADLESILRDADKTTFVGGTTSTSITPIDVGEGNEYEYTTFQRILTLTYKFGDADAIVGSIVYFYRVYPNVEFEINYPDPDGSGENAQEFVTNDTTQRYTLAGTAEFAHGPRVSTDLVADVKAMDQSVQDLITQRISVEISDISLVVLKYAGASLEGVGTTGILAGFDLNTEFTLELVEGAAGDGYIVFVVTCNEVTQEYRMDVITAEDTISIKSNAPNYTNNHEVVYVEDLSVYEDLDLFASNRILNMTFSNNASLGTTYYIRLKEKNGNKIKVVEAKVERRTPNAVNVDMGNVYGDYEYVATYSTAELAQSGDVGAIDNLYIVYPNVTNRLMFKYYNGRIISGAVSQVTRVEPEPTTANYTFNGLTSNDYNNRTDGVINEVALNVDMKYNDEVRREAIGTYTLQPAVEFDVKGNADTFSAENPAVYASINANPEADLSLLEYFTVFRIMNVRTNQLYTPTMMADSRGKLSVQIYGFEECPIDNAEVWAYHNNMDITPRANGYEIDANGWDSDFEDLTTTYNYITLSAKTIKDSNNKNVNGADWLIRAQGARNEGDYVMLKIGYTVSFGNNESIEVWHNALIKVEPNSRVTIYGNRVDETGEYTGEGEGSAWASNQDNPIPVTNNPTIVIDPEDSTQEYKVNKRTIAPRIDLGGNANDTDLVVWLYGNSGAGGNNASSERMSYSIESNKTIGKVKYNTLLIEDMTGAGQQYEGIEAIDGAGSTLFYRRGSADVQIVMPELTLGERYYCIEAKDAFNFQIRIYYKLVGDINPHVTLSSSTLTEETPLVFAAAYTAMGATTMNIVNVVDTNKNSIKVQTFDRYEDATTGQQKTLDNTNMPVSGNWTVSQNPTLYFIFEGVSYTLGDDTFTNQTVIGARKYNSGSYGSATWYNAAGTQVTSFDPGSNVYKLGINVKDSVHDAESEFSFQGSVKHGSVEILPTYSSVAENESIGIEEARAGDTDLRNAEVATLTGIYSYGFTTNPSNENYLGLVTTAGIGETYKSYIGDITVTSIELIVDENTTEKSEETSKSLTASQHYKFVNKSDGSVYTSAATTKANNAIEIPTINGVHYGKNNAIAGITLVINIQDKAGHTGQAIVNNVTIKRNEPQLFTTNEVYDGEGLPSKTGNVAEIINDTLEVHLKAKTTDETPSVTLSLKYDGVEGATEYIYNDKNYAVTKYISISSHAVLTNRNLKKTDSITISVKEEGTTEGFGYIRYNGTRYDLDGEAGDYSFEIEQLNNNSVKLHIEDKNFLSQNVQASDKVENVSLYFIYYENEESNTKLYYQSEQKFTILPTWCGIDGPRNQQGGIQFVVSSYSKFEDDPNQLVIQKDNWAGQISLLDSNGTTTQLNDNSVKDYKLTYKINNDNTGGAGAAYIDEFGNIVTSKDFDVATGTITINLYMKVSGADDKWDGESDRKLGSLRISLDGSVSPGDVTINNLLMVTTPTPSETAIPNEFAYEKGSVVNIKELFDAYVKKNEASGNYMDNNTHYHIIQTKKYVDGTPDHDITTNYIGNNIDTWEFEYTGKYTLTIRVHGYNTDNGAGHSDGSCADITANFYIYDTSESTPTYVYIAKGQSFTYGSNCYDINNDGSLVAKPNETFEESGRFERAFITKNGANFAYARYVFYVFDGEETYDVAKTRNGSWNLSNLNAKLGKTSATYYTFVADPGKTDGTLTGDIVAVTAYSETSGGAASYLVRFNDHTYKLVHINFLIVDSIGTTYAGYMRKDVANPLTTKIEAFFVSRGENFKIYAYETNGNGILKEFEEPEEISGSIFQNSYVVVNNGAATRLNVTFFPYEEMIDVSCEAEQSIAWPLSRLNATILEELGLAEGTSMRYYKADGTSLTEYVVVSTEDLSTELHDTFFVSVGDKYYLVNVTLTRE